VDQRAWFNLGNGTVGTIPAGWTAQITRRQTAVPVLSYINASTANYSGLGATGDQQANYVGLTNGVSSGASN
jgi:hypothetical protein